MIVHGGDQNFPVVALGASAGGLRALSAFFTAVEALGEPPGMAFVVITHLAPHEESHMADLLQKRTRVPVAQVTENTVIEADHVYVLAPNEILCVRHGQLEPQPRSSEIPPHPVDDLFRSLGVEFGPRAVAIILSGTGPNGSAGLSTVKENGGIVLAQTPETCDFADMPRNAIATGLVDAVLPPKEMIDVLGRYADHLHREPDQADGEAADAAGAGGEAAAGGQADGAPSAHDAILETLRVHTGLDFRRYKAGILERRIDRRVGLHRLGDWHAYAEFLRETPEEREILANDLLITVTGFFRDEEAWEVLLDKAVRPLIAAQSPDEPFRAWVAGCASGEEAYSLGMLLAEEARAQEKHVAIDIFATDASARALARARQGRYPGAAVQHLSTQRLDAFFNKEGDSYRVKHELREHVVFAPQNLIQDPPFSRVKLVICRNVLIYLRPELQQKLLRLFHFALGEGGYLFLGSAENINGSEDLFEAVSTKWRLYRRTQATRHDIFEFPINDARSRHSRLHLLPETEQDGPERIAETSLRALVERHVPPSVVVDRKLNILYYHGATGRFIRPQSGEPTNDLLALARDGLGRQLRRLMEKVPETGRPERERARLVLEGREVSVDIEVAPVERTAGGTLFLVSFLENEPAETAGSVDEQPVPHAEHHEDDEVRLLREELRATLRSANRAREEHESHKEEVMSMNEELRSTNEELETSKEELHSLNEELNTVNAQLRDRLDELQERTNDINNLLVSTDVATLFLDAGFNIRWFAPGIRDLFNIRASDTGRPIADLVQKFADEDFSTDCERVLRTLAPAEKQVRSSDGRWFVRRILPYRTMDDRIDGIVVTFSDVTAIQAARNYAEEIVETVPVPLLVLDWELRVVSANPAFYETFEVRREKTEKRLVYDLGNGQWNIPKLRGLLTEVLGGNDNFKDYEVEHAFEEIGIKSMLLRGCRIDHMQLILLAIEDITEAKRSEAHRTMLMSELSHRVKNVLGVVQGLASQTLIRSKSLKEFGTVFEGRLGALARGHAQLLEGEWKPADLADVVQSVIEAFGPERVDAEGPRVEIPPRKALALNLILHELETNAIKYGAFSAPDGRVGLDWTLEDEDRIQLVWQERHGPPVVPPEREGYGSTLIRQLLQYEMDGSARLSFEPDGLRCELVFSTR